MGRQRDLGWNKQAGSRKKCIAGRIGIDRQTVMEQADGRRRERLIQAVVLVQIAHKQRWTRPAGGKSWCRLWYPQRKADGEVIGRLAEAVGIGCGNGIGREGLCWTGRTGGKVGIGCGMGMGRQRRNSQAGGKCWYRMWYQDGCLGGQADFPSRVGAGIQQQTVIFVI